MSGPGLGLDAIGTVAQILRRSGHPTVFAHSSDCRHALRAELCRKGWGWHAAEMKASETVNAALRRVGARWPRWEEGQPEWTQAGVVTAPRERCVACNKTLAEDQWRYCSRHCVEVWRHRIATVDAQAWSREEVSRDWRAKVLAKIPDRLCRGCGTKFKPAILTAKACDDCRDRSR